MDITELLTTPDGAVLAAIGGDDKNHAVTSPSDSGRIETPKAYRNAPHACARARINARKAELVAA